MELFHFRSFGSAPSCAKLPSDQDPVKIGKTSVLHAIPIECTHRIECKLQELSSAKESQEVPRYSPPPQGNDHACRYEQGVLATSAATGVLDRSGGDTHGVLMARDQRLIHKGGRCFTRSLS